ncbi:MAG: GNAT family N-acetyltransferase, partial [Verrucomicrobiales bacterium]
ARGDRVSVRAFEESRDKELFNQWLTDDYGRYFLLSRISGRRTEVDTLVKNPKHILGVIELNSGRPIGAVAYLDHDGRRHKAELRKLIGDPDYRGSGLAKEATELWLRYGLSTLGLKKVYVNTLHTHFRNIKLNESLGFKVEGLLHNEALIDGKYQDVLRMGLWNQD